MEDKKRTPNFTVKEKMSLLGIVEKYKDIVENKGTACSINEQKNSTWVKIAAEFNSETETCRTVKHLRLLYANLKRKTSKDVAEEHKEQYLRAKLTAEEDGRELKKTGGGSYKLQLDDTGAQMLAIMDQQIEPLCNQFDDAADYFCDIPIEIPGTSFEPLVSPEVQPVPSPDLNHEHLNPEPNPNKPKTTRKCRQIVKTKKKVDYKNLYFKKNMRQLALS